MTEEALQIDFRPQPSGIAVVTSAPISTIAESGNYAAFQDLIDGYASSFAKVHVFSPSGGSVVKPLKGHRVKWHSGPRWLSPTNGLWWSVLSNRREFENIELVRTFGPRAGVVGKALSKLAKSPHVSSSDDLNGNTWRDRTGWRAAPTKVVNRLGLLRANMLAATLDWEVEYLSETGYTKDLLLGKTGLPTDVYTPVGTTDPNRHPVVLWAGPVTGDDAVSLIAESALATKSMIENVEFVVVADADDAKQLQADVTERELPVTIAAFDQIEPLVDLIERTWACVTVPSSGFPHGFGMFAASAGVPMISVGELDESHGFKNHLNYMGVEPDSHDAVAYALQLLRRWSTWSLRIGSAGQQLIEDRYSTKTVALREGEQLARIARDEELETDSPVQLKALRPYLSPATGEALPFGIDTDAESVEEEPEAEDQYSGAGFDMVAAALAGLASDAAAAKSSPPKDESSSEDMGQDAISALFAANDAAPAAEPAGDMGQDAISALFAANDTAPAAEPAGDMGQDAISALFAANDADPEVPSAEPVDLGAGDMDQDAISALFASNHPAPAAEPAGDMDQDAISALFAANDPAPAAEPAGDMDQDAISAMFAANDPAPAAEPAGDMDQDAISAMFAANDPAPAAEPAGDMGQDAISAMFAANDPAPAAEPAGDMDQDAISAMFAANDPAPAAEPAGEMDQDAISALFAADDPAPAAEPAGDMGQDAISALFAANDTADVVEPEPVPAVESTGEMDQDAISALFASSDPAPASSPEPVNEADEDFVSAIIEAKNNSPEKVVTAEDLDDTDMPQVNIVKFDGASDVEEEEDVTDEFDSIDIDPSLIASILEGKDVDPYV